MRAKLFVSQKSGIVQRFWCLLFSISLILSSSCRTSSPPASKTFNDFPQKILWAWERPENLEFIDTTQFGVAFLAQTIQLTEDRVEYYPRRQPLKVSPETRLIAVTRIETGKQTDKKAGLSDPQQAEILRYILKTTELKNVSAIQIDFDATASEREFYRKILIDLRQRLKDFPISITALASFCIDDNWVKDLPVDEVVPMIFRMGADEKTVKNFLANGTDFRAGLCRTSYGIAVDEPIKASLNGGRRIYFFNVRPWTQKDVESLRLPTKD